MKNIVLKTLVLALIGLGSANAAFDEKVAGSDSSSGCGYGWEVTKGKTLSASSTRGTTNATASNTIAMTMGTSGCEKHDIVMKDKEQLHFANVNHEMILADMSLGQGEYLNSFAEVLGCNADDFGVQAQAHLEEIMAANGAALLRNVQAHPALRQACL